MLMKKKKIDESFESWCLGCIFHRIYFGNYPIFKNLELIFPNNYPDISSENLEKIKGLLDNNKNKRTSVDELFKNNKMKKLNSNRNINKMETIQETSIDSDKISNKNSISNKKINENPEDILLLISNFSNVKIGEKSNLKKIKDLDLCYFKKNISSLLARSLINSQIYSIVDDNIIVNYILGKKLFFNHKSIIKNLKENNYQDNLLKITEKEMEIYEKFYKIIYKEILEFFVDTEEGKYIKIDYDNRFDKFYKDKLIIYFKYLYKQAKKCEKLKGQQNSAFKIYFHCYEIYHCIKIDEIKMGTNFFEEFENILKRIKLQNFEQIKNFFEEEIIPELI